MEDGDAVARVRAAIESLSPDATRLASALDAARRAAVRREQQGTTAVERCRNVLLAASLTAHPGDVDLDGIDLLAVCCVEQLLETLDPACAAVLREIDVDGTPVVTAARHVRSSVAVTRGRLRWARHAIACRLAEATAEVPPVIPSVRFGA